MKKIVLLAMVVGCLCLPAVSVQAVSLSLVPAFQKVSVGGTASVDLVVDDLGAFAPDSLGSFFVDIIYDPAILSITDTDVTFGAFLGEPSIDASAFASISSGLVHLDETSFLFPAELDALQPSSFTLATLDFTGIAFGFSRLDFITADLGDAFGFSFDEVTTSGAGAGVAPVPEPATMLLLGTGLVGLAGLSRKRIFKR